MGKLTRQFSEDKIKMANKYMKQCLIFLTIKKKQIKTTLRFYLTPARLATIKKTKNKWWQGYGAKGTLIHCWWEYKQVQPLLESSMNIPQKSKNSPTL
jgi:hypothetical protein